MSSFSSVNPATGETLGTFPALSPDQLDAGLETAWQASLEWRRVPVAERVAVLRRAADLLDERSGEYGELMTREMGKPIGAARAEAGKCAACCRYYANNAESILAPETIVKADGERGEVRYQPLGVVLAVMPWNFPFWQVIRFAAPAILAGNVGLLKHASNVPQCALALEQLFRDAGAPDGVFTTLLVGSDAVAGILDDDRVAAATLTGSERAGSAVAERAGKRIKKTVLELGGSDPFVVMPSADMDAAARVAVQARTINNGQSCIAAKRFIVHESVYDAFMSRIVPAMESLTVGDPMDERTQVGPLATTSIAEELHDQVLRSVQAGARVLTGGDFHPAGERFYQPTVLVDAPDDSPAAAEELFGPVATVFRARDLDHAIEIANRSRFGLGASAWSDDPDEQERLASELEAGSVFINAMVASDSRFPFGGIKRSGYGRELSPWGLREFVNVKTVRLFTQGTGGKAANTE
jgi:succinate-semialdehyde dehydrogenase/glutarate-semialdehyde dehydrogenase